MECGIWISVMAGQITVLVHEETCEILEDPIRSAAKVIKEKKLSLGRCKRRRKELG